MSNDPRAALTLDEVEQRIRSHYEFFAQVAPGVTPREEGELGLLWRIHDDMTMNMSTEK